MHTMSEEKAPEPPQNTERGHPATARQVAFVGFYVLVLLTLYNIGSIGVAGVPFQFILKDVLKLGPQQQAIFGFLADAPFYVGFLFGFLRDRWRPFGRGDRGYFLFLPPLLAAANLLLAYGAYTYPRVLVATLFIATIGLLLGAAANGLLTIIAQYHGMTGRLAVALLITPRLLGILSNAIGGHLADAAHQHLAYLYSAALCLPMMAMAFWRPGPAFAHENEVLVRAVPEGTLQALKRLAAHRTVYLPAAILFLWNFAPGWGTPLFNYLTVKIKLSESAYGNSQAFLGGGVLVFTLAYGVLCYRMRLRTLLYMGTFLGVLGCPIFLLIHNQIEANIISFLAGASLSIALCAFNDLLIRCCPRDLEGAALLFVGAMSAIAGDTSNILGAWLYEKGGFGLALAVSTLFTGLIFGVLPFIPSRLTTPHEGKRWRKPVLQDSSAAEPEIVPA
jgi:MFS family permease